MEGLQDSVEVLNSPMEVQDDKSLDMKISDIDDQVIDDLDLLGDLELEELDNIVSFADNKATRLAMETQNKLRKMGTKVKDMGQKSKS